MIHTVQWLIWLDVLVVGDTGKRKHFEQVMPPMPSIVICLLLSSFASQREGSETALLPPSPCLLHQRCW